MRVALFPGQGIGAREILAALPEHHPLLDAADEMLGFGLRRRVEAEARRPRPSLATDVCQPAIYLAGICAYRRAEDEGRSFDHFAGHSLGEYAALAAAGAISDLDALRAVVARGRAMHEAGTRSPGGMAAVLGLSLDQVEAVAERAGVAVANDNAPGQAVLAGPEERVSEAARLVGELGGRSVLLKVAGAFHTDAMAPAAEVLRDALDHVTVRSPHAPVVSNVTARPYRAPGEIRKLLVHQLSQRVRFRESLEYLFEQGVASCEDLGPGKVAAGLADRTFRALREAARV